MVMFFNPLCMEKPQVWVKATNETIGGKEVSVFVNNDDLVRLSIGQTMHSPEQWCIGDNYYGMMVREGKFVPLDDLRETDSICKRNGWPAYVIDFGF